MSWRDTPPEFTMPTFCCAQEQNKSEICTQSRQKLGLERQKERGDASPHKGGEEVQPHAAPNVDKGRQKCTFGFSWGKG